MDTTMLNGNSPQALIELVRRLMLEVNTCIPGEIVDFDGEKQIATVKPCIRGTTIMSDGKVKYVDLPQVVQVPVILPYGTVRKFSLTYAVETGDQCLILFSQRSFDKWLSNGSVNNPTEPGKPRSHLYTDAIAIVGMIPNTETIDKFQGNGIEIRNETRNSFVKVMDDIVRVHCGRHDLYLQQDGTLQVSLQQTPTEADAPVPGMTYIQFTPEGTINVVSANHANVLVNATTNVTSIGPVTVNAPLSTVNITTDSIVNTGNNTIVNAKENAVVNAKNITANAVENIAANAGVSATVSAGGTLTATAGGALTATAGTATINSPTSVIIDAPETSCTGNLFVGGNFVYAGDMTGTKPPPEEPQTVDSPFGINVNSPQSNVSGSVLVEGDIVYYGNLRREKKPEPPPAL